MKASVKSFIAMLLGLLGFSACKDGIIEDRTGLAEYGQPSADFKFIGRAADAAGKPIPGVRVVVAPQGEDDPYYGGFLNDTLYTDAQGRVEKERLKYDWPDTRMMAVKFEDVDGEENGEYGNVVLSEKDLRIEQTQKGSGNWYEGVYTITAEATLPEKSE